METPRKFIIAKLSIRKLGANNVNNNVNKNAIISTDEDPSLRIESFAIIGLRGVSTMLKSFYSPCKRTMNLVYNLQGDFHRLIYII